MGEPLLRRSLHLLLCCLLAPCWSAAHAILCGRLSAGPSSPLGSEALLRLSLLWWTAVLRCRLGDESSSPLGSDVLLCSASLSLWAACSEAPSEPGSTSKTCCLDQQLSRVPALILRLHKLKVAYYVVFNGTFSQRLACVHVLRGLTTHTDPVYGTSSALALA